MPTRWSRVRGETAPMIGHNGGPPLDAALSWRRHCWGAARKALAPHLPLEIVRMRVARARELGLSYPAYASILLGTGRDVVAFLFTAEAIGLRLRRTVPLAEPVAERLRAIARADRLLLAEPGEAPQALARRLALAHRIDFAGIAPAPGTGALAAGRQAIRDLLAPLKLPGDGVVMVGTRAAERDWADAARLAKFMASDGYFGAAPGA